ncbi:MAG: aspartyl protease family protein, partial [Bacteroidales bacterium]|nr:aspartyl protease family protein [Bacteroidales bacterium]
MKQFILITLSVVFTIDCNANVLPDGAFPVVYEGGWIYIDGRADSAKGNFIFDTGADNLYLDSTWSAGNTFLLHKNFFNAKLRGIGVKQQHVKVINGTVTFTFEDNIYKTNNVPVLQLKKIVGDFSDGIIGIEYFYPYVMEINYIDEYIKLYNSIDSVNVADYLRIHLKKRNNRLYIPLSVKINDTLTISGNFLFDCGSGNSISFTSAAVKKYNLNKIVTDKAEYFSAYGGIGSESRGFVFRAKQVEIGNYKFNDVTMLYSTDKKGALSSSKYSGLLGNKILERFDIIIDFVNNDLYLKANENYKNPFTFSRLGFTYVDRSQTMGVWIVSAIFKNSNAKKAGLKINDKIISINGKNVSEIPFRNRKEYFKDNIELVIKRDKKIKVFQLELKP